MRCGRGPRRVTGNEGVASLEIATALRPSNPSLHPARKGPPAWRSSKARDGRFPILFDPDTFDQSSQGDRISKLRSQVIPFIDISAQRHGSARRSTRRVPRAQPLHHQTVRRVTQLREPSSRPLGRRHVVIAALPAPIAVDGADGQRQPRRAVRVRLHLLRTGEAVALAGATPVFVDVDETDLQHGSGVAERAGSRPRSGSGSSPRP